MVLYNKYKFRQQEQQKKKKKKKRKSLDNPVVYEASEFNFHKPHIDYLLSFRKEMDARGARVANLAMKRRLLEGQTKDNYTLEIGRLRLEMHSRRIPETSVEHLRNRIQTLEALSERTF